MYSHFKFWASILTIFACLLSSLNSKASHVLGSEISYKHIAGDTFLIRLKIYRDCHGINLSGAPFTLTPKGKKSYTDTARLLYGGYDVTPVCKKSCTYCKSTSCTFNFGIQEYFLETIAVLPDCEYTISWEECCRSNNISTGAAGQTYKTFVKMDKCSAGPISSPDFVTPPYILGCINQCTTVLQGAEGTLGDSLVYKFAQPLNDPVGQPIAYNYPYSYDEPFMYDGMPNKNTAYDYPKCKGLHLDAQTGELNFKAMQEALTVMVIEVEQWRKDTSNNYRLISTIRKDAILNLLNCAPNNQPTVSGINNTNSAEINICANDTARFTIYSADTDNDDSVTIKWNKNINGATFNTSKDKKQSAEFKWAPTEQQVKDEPYWFVVRAEDNKCPVPAYIEKKYKVYVHAAFDSLKIIHGKRACNTYSFNIQSSHSLKNYKFRWFVNDSLVGNDSIMKFNFNKTGNNIVRLTADGNCIKHFFDTIYIEKPIDVLNRNYDTICIGDTITLTAAGGQIFKWYPVENISDKSSQTIKLYPRESSKYYVTVTDTSKNCTRIDSLNITVNKPSYNISVTPSICIYDTTKIVISGSNNTYKWQPNPTLDSIFSSSPNVYPTSKTTYYVTITDTVVGCSIKDSIIINVDTTCVWPGDANLDKTADYLDILDIALGYSTTGIPRVNASTDWQPQIAKDWSKILSSGVNYKHLDTNGDSIIDANDTFAVAKNYGKTHLKNDEPQLAGNPNDPPLFFQFDKNYYLAGETVKATLYLGSAEKHANDVYGLGLKHFFANPYMENNTYKFNWDCDMLCGAKDNFQLYRQFNDKGIGEGSIIRTDKLTTNNPFGKVAEMQFLLKDSTFNYPKSGINMSLQIIKSKLIDMLGNEIPLYTLADTVKVYRSQKDVVGVKGDVTFSRSDIKIYPNPANNILIAESPKHFLSNVYIANILGQEVKNMQLSQVNQTQIDISDLPDGIYFMHISLGEKLLTKKFIISR